MASTTNDRPGQGGNGSARPDGSLLIDLGGGTAHANFAPADADELNEAERRQYAAASDWDRAWFARHPRRRLRLRPATPAERKAFAAAGSGLTHMLVERIEGGRLRRPVHWSIPGPPPESDAVLARLLAGSLVTGGGSRA